MGNSFIALRTVISLVLGDSAIQMRKIMFYKVFCQTAVLASTNFGAEVGQGGFIAWLLAHEQSEKTRSVKKEKKVVFARSKI